jgi:hypothetical protein
VAGTFGIAPQPHCFRFYGHAGGSGGLQIYNREPRADVLDAWEESGDGLEASPLSILKIAVD